MSTIYVTTYTVIGAGVDIAKAYYAKCADAQKTQWAFVEEVGGRGMRPGHDGGLRSVFFEKLPSGWRKRGLDGVNIEAVPLKSSSAGKAIEARIQALPRSPNPSELASALGYNPSEMALDGAAGKIYFPSELRVLFPKERIFVRLPRFTADNFAPDPTILRAIPESELMRACEDHNAHAKRLREGGAA